MNSTPLYRISPEGQPEQLGLLVHSGCGFHLEAATDLPRWMLGVQGYGEFPDLPFFAEDLRPQGYLGTIVTDGDPEQWSSARVLSYLTSAGRDLPGDLILGSEMLDQVGQEQPTVITDPGEFDALADLVSAGGSVPGGALVGGAQPKFCAITEAGPVIVKFVPISNRRMCDLLLAEHLALLSLADAGIPAAESKIYQSERYTHLEVVRFDRVGERGRLPLISLKALDAEYVGVGHGWAAIMAALCDEGLVREAEVERSDLLNLYGMMIENTDRHAGNLSLMPDATGHLVLAPVYDMLPMRYAMFDGDLTHPPALQVPAREDARVWEYAVELARIFWTRVQADKCISEPFRALARVRAGELEQVDSESRDRPK